MTMEIKEIVLMVIGAMVSMIAFYLKKESAKISNLGDSLRRIQIKLAENEARDTERWNQTSKLLEDRREDTIKLYEKLEKK
jgi:uncharacterized membrane-anchored protein YhcB (DUF1043 family)